MEYLKSSFSVGMKSDSTSADEFARRWELTFGKKGTAPAHGVLLEEQRLDKKPVTEERRKSHG